MNKTKQPASKRIAFIGNYLPRQCGIAAFTTDLCEALADEYEGTARMALPVNDIEVDHTSVPRVQSDIAKNGMIAQRHLFWNQQC